MSDKEDGGRQVWVCPYNQQVLSRATVSRSQSLSGLSCLGFKTTPAVLSRKSSGNHSSVFWLTSGKVVASPDSALWFEVPNPIPCAVQ